ncbi:glycosyltransferase family 2 protein [Vibrio breoganii]|uniref:glycosyltransferase family 2 protein n=1 Tax=Vibrio breoganii TaxID=553239 RepID=UPI000C85181D|nr:glycosyltransferase family 2 protein [Vibrio breoganii]PML40460.1 hypothetical protein BCT77_07275 [Vibrio breoganii]PMO77626.1 hypothetical protein BCT02_07340 [Vibrio breoganii]PMO86537.1 hypothetical protein BCS99_11340 [Vibrio breoganii]
MSGVLVSIVSPCYNGELYITRFLESILTQDYDNIELIVIDDGSTDQTLFKMRSFEKKFEQKGYRYTVISQSNQGQAAAINLALPLVRGTYLCWPDSDDVLTPSSISDKVSFLEKKPHINIVRSDVEFVDEQFKHLYKASDKHMLNTRNIFEDLILERNVYFCPGGYMVRMGYFDRVINNRKIICSRAGQNWQILLPVCKNNECGYLDKVTYQYVVRTGSHSRSNVSFVQSMQKYEAHRSLLLDIVRSLGAEQYSDVIKKKYQKKFIYLAVQHREYRKALAILKNNFSLVNLINLIKAEANRYRKKK